MKYRIQGVNTLRLGGNTQVPAFREGASRLLVEGFRNESGDALGVFCGLWHLLRHGSCLSFQLRWESYVPLEGMNNVRFTLNVNVLFECDLAQGKEWGVRENRWHNKRHYPTYLTGSAAYLHQSLACCLCWWVLTPLSWPQRGQHPPTAATYPKTHLLILESAHLASEKHPAASTNAVWNHWSINISVSHGTVWFFSFSLCVLVMKITWHLATWL